MTQKLLTTLLLCFLLLSADGGMPNLNLPNMNPLAYFCGPCKSLLEKFRCRLPTADEVADKSLSLLIQQQCAMYTAGIPFAVQMCVKAGKMAIDKILDKIKENVNTGRRLHPEEDCTMMKFCSAE
ncbi:unnamed protein product [Bursaphelenchus okinawaensis]|uniref:Saposin B-type domain-containing protein n=1 Tax=Bursaphelenchus okinawaensis TaxID=465554 RepID=A0A811K5N5_9BILA|nr:unnamed protein product [Bursaphelenchus okinawaensis]CAG9091913.1 unnamed protein product [Bursaphelenchus okinawaensis]